jgi:hypothetical protein
MEVHIKPAVLAKLEQMARERQATAPAAGAGPTPELPILHLGAMGAFHRRDIYDDACWGWVGLCPRQSGKGQQRDRRAARHLTFARSLPRIFTA